MFSSFESYQNEIWSNTSVLYDKHLEHAFGSMWETGTSSKPLNDFIKMTM